jgi:hypothetical protein
MNFFVAVTDYDWFQLHASKPSVVEVNFWRPSPEASFKALDPGEMLLFKLHSPRNFIVGGGFFTRFVHLPISLSWEAFGEGNGVRSLSEMRERIAKYRPVPIDPLENPKIGCILLAEPFFLGKQNGFQCLRISALILFREKDTTAKTEQQVRPSGERSPKDWRRGLLRTLTPAQQLSQRSRVSATANPLPFDRDLAKAHSE